MINILVKVKNVMNKILSAASVVLLVFMTSLVLWQVFTRYVLGKPAAFTEELVKYSLMWTAFIGAAYAFFTRDHMSLTIIKDKLTGNKRKILLLVIDVLILLLAVFVFVIGGFKLAMSARAEYSALLGIPRTLVYAVSPVSGIFIVVAQIINIYEYCSNYSNIICCIRCTSVFRCSYFSKYYCFVNCNCHVNAVMGSDNIHNHAENEFGC